MLYVIADLHLSTMEGMNKSMEIFGRRWSGYVDKLRRNWTAVVEPEDSVVVPGDISWALSLRDAVCDLHFLDDLPGHKYIGKGNHDFWWSTAAKMEKLFAEEGIASISLLNNNAWLCENDFILCGTRGWYQDESCDNMPKDTDFDKLVTREAMRLKLSLESGHSLAAENPGREMLAFLHFPPIWNGLHCQPILDLLQEYGIRRCFFGHIHSNYTAPASFVEDGIRFSLISADFLNFSPRPILPDIL
ncbi:MAG: metallophosphoesterase [Clostridia bacterium]|nr:metallophosphoesterase [Clostridia bacterium]